MADFEDYPLEEIAIPVQREINAGNEVHQKFTCELCGQRVMIEEPNQLFTAGRHDDCPVEPGHVTNLRERGANYMVISRSEGYLPYDGQRRKF